MNFTKLAVPTQMINAGMTVRDVFKECVKQQVPGLPFVDDEGKIIGRVSLRDIFKLTCMPEYVVKSVHYLGDDLNRVNLLGIDAEEILNRNIQEYVLENMAVISSDSPLVKCLAIMEHYNTNYVFLMNEDNYQGVVTRIAIAECLLEVKESEVR
jgi:predicted transcriptional regulator